MSAIHRHGHSWTEEEILRARELRQSGMTNAQIASQLGRTKSAVLSRLQNPNTACLKPKAPWLPGDEIKAQQLHAQGLPLAEIARQLGRTRDSICTRLSDLRCGRSYHSFKVLAESKASALPSLNSKRIPGPQTREAPGWGLFLNWSATS